MAPLDVIHNRQNRNLGDALQSIIDPVLNCNAVFFMKYFHHEKCQNIFDFYNNFGYDGCSDSPIVVGPKL